MTNSESLLSKGQNTLIVNLIFLISMVFIFGSAIVFFLTDNPQWTLIYKHVLLASFGLSVVGIVANYFSRINFSFFLILFCSFICLATGFGAALLAVFYFWLSVFAIGHFFWKWRVGDEEFTETNTALNCTSGYIILSLVLMVLAYSNYNYAWVFILGTMFTNLLYLKHVYLNFSGQKIIEKNVSKETWISRFLFTLVITILLIFTLQPDIGSDSINAYRANLLELLHNGNFTWGPDQSSIGLVSKAGVWSQAFAVIISRDYAAAKLINFTNLAISFYLIRVFVRNFVFIESRTKQSGLIGNLTASVLLSVPILLYTSVQGFYDNVVYLQCLMLLFLVTSTSRVVPSKTLTGLTISIGLLSGLIVLTKLTNLYLVPLIAGFILFHYFKKYNLKTGLRHLLLLTLISGLVVTSYFAFVYIHTGNPVFPFYNGIFKSEYFTQANFSSPHKGHMELSLLWDVTFDTARYSDVGAKDGQFGLIAVIAAMLCTINIFTYKRVKSNLKAMGIGSLCMFFIGLLLLSFSQNSARYLIVLIPFLCFPFAAFLLSIGSGRALILSTTIVISQIYLMPNYGYGFSETSAVFKNNHREVIFKNRPLRLVADDLMIKYGRTGRVLFIGGNGGYAGKTFQTGWYDNSTRSQFLKLKFTSDEDIENFLKEKQLDAVVVSNQGLRFLHNIGGVSIIEYLQDQSNGVQIYNVVRVYSLKPNLAYRSNQELKPETIKARKVLARISKISSAKVEIKTICKSPNTSIIMRTISPKKTSTGYTAHNLTCNDKVEELAMELPEINPEDTLIVSIAGPKVLGVRIIEGNIWGR